MAQGERQQKPLGIVDAQTLLASGHLVPPTDEVTANAYDLWKDTPPLYHDVSCLNFTKFDIKEWAGKMRKYKAEVVRYADQCRRLEKEVQDLQDEMGKDTGKFEEVEAQVQATKKMTEEIKGVLQEELARRNLNSVECTALRRVRLDVRKQQKIAEKEIGEARTRIGLLQTEIEHNRRRHVMSLGESNRLNLERKWFYQRRLLLEATTMKEIEEIAAIKGKLEKLRYAMHSMWRDTKELDLLGHSRATKKNKYSEEWFAARKRTFLR